uniref:Bromo domain-containing protein n=1 Tax=Gongylonema pulchrum TaxID=637853 RepID=A0A183DZ78_9BILA
LEQDIRYIAVNARLFNQPNSEIVRNSRVLVETLISYLNDRDYTNALELFRQLKTGPDSRLREYNNIKKCILTTNVSKKAIKLGTNPTLTRNTSMDHAWNWFEECATVLEEVMNEQSSSYFIAPGYEPLQDVFSTRDNLSAVKNKVRDRKYSSPLEVVNAVKTFMQACRNAIDNKRSPVFRSSLTVAASFESKMAPVVAKWQRMRHRHEDSEVPTSSAVAPCRPGRSGRLPNGYYRYLNNGTYMGQEPGPSSFPSTSSNRSANRTRNATGRNRIKRSDQSSASTSLSEQDLRTPEAKGRSLRNLSEQNGNNHRRVRLRRSVQRNVNYNENVGLSDGDDDEASNSSIRQVKRRR